MFRIAIYEFCVHTSVCFLLSALVGGFVGVGTEFTGVDDIAAWGAILPLPEGVHSFYIL